LANSERARSILTFDELAGSLAIATKVQQGSMDAAVGEYTR